VLFGKLDWLKAFVPSLKILFLKRDPRSIVSSVLRSNFIHFWNYAHLVPPAFAAMHPHYLSKARTPGEMAAEVVAMSVATRYEMARRSIQNFEHRELHLEDLMQNPHEGLETITRFLGVDADDEPLSFLKRRQLESRGGPFSSFRAANDVVTAWERHLNAEQLRVIEEVLHCEPVA